MSSLSVLVKDAGFSNNLRSLVELARFVVQRIVAAHALQPVEASTDAEDAVWFSGVSSHDELEQRLRQRDNGHLYALTVLRAEI